MDICGRISTGRVPKRKGWVRSVTLSLWQKPITHPFFIRSSPTFCSLAPRVLHACIWTVRLKRRGLSIWRSLRLAASTASRTNHGDQNRCIYLPNSRDFHRVTPLYEVSDRTRRRLCLDFSWSQHNICNFKTAHCGATTLATTGFEWPAKVAPS